MNCVICQTQNKVIDITIVMLVFHTCFLIINVKTWY